MNCKPTVLLPLGPALIASLLLAAGCATDAGHAGGIDSLHVFSVPVALDLDGSPGPDSFGLTLYASAAAIPRGVLITTGRIEILMYDGALPPGGNTNATPVRVWTFTAADLKNRGIKSSLGIGYRFTPRWGDTPPTESRITVVAPFVSARQTSVQSAPTTIAVSAK